MVNPPALAATATPALASIKRSMLGPQSARTILANIAYLYRHHFGAVTGCSLLPMLVALIVRVLSVHEKQTSVGNPAVVMWSLVALAGSLMYLAAALLCGPALTVVLSDVCTGNAPSLRRAFSHVLKKGRWWRSMAAGVLSLVAYCLGIILLILPGLWGFARLMFMQVIIVLEGRSVRSSIGRSLALTKGDAWRLVGLNIVIGFIAWLAATVVLVLLYVGAMMVGWTDAFISELFSFALVTLIPTVSMGIVLLYYDERVRRESYDAYALSEDLMR